MPFAMTWLAGVLRNAGQKVEEVPGWENRGRGEMGDVRGILCHHTAGPAKGDAPSLKLVTEGRKDLAGPLSQLVLGRDGTWHVVAAGRCNHAGAGEWQGITAGNSSFIGIEAENMGTLADPWPKVQMDAYITGCTAILSHLRQPAIMVAGHKEYALPKGRKIDPSFDMVTFRTQVARVMKLSPATIVPSVKLEVPPVDPHTAMLQLGSVCDSVGELQRMLHLPVTCVFDADIDRAVRKFQADHGLVVDGKVGPATWKKLGI